jgi:RNA methyltransferase, TrmH family
MQRTTPHTPLTGKDNGFIKKLRSLADPKQRKKEHAFLIEGVKMVEEALRDKAGVQTVVASPGLVQHHGKGILKLAENEHIEVVWISERLMDSLAESKSPQPVMAVVGAGNFGEDDLLSCSSGLIIVAHQFQDPGNLGTIIRTAEAVGASGVAVTAGTVDPHNAKAVRASMGSILRVPVVPMSDLKAFLSACRQKGFQITATTIAGTTTHFDADFIKPTVVILGQEGSGLPRDLMDCIDVSLRIPMADAIDSLNVATAAAVVLYEAMRQRRSKEFGKNRNGIS